MSAFIYNIQIGDGDNMKKEDLSAQVNSSNQTYTVSEDYKTGSLRVYWNGVRQIELVTFSESTSTTFSTTFIANTGDYLTIDYKPN